MVPGKFGLSICIKFNSAWSGQRFIFNFQFIYVDFSRFIPKSDKWSLHFVEIVCSIDKCDWRWHHNIRGWESDWNVKNPNGCNLGTYWSRILCSLFGFSQKTGWKWKQIGYSNVFWICRFIQFNASLARSLHFTCHWNRTVLPFGTQISEIFLVLTDELF